MNMLIVRPINTENAVFVITFGNGANPHNELILASRRLRDAILADIFKAKILDL
jgi:hypothetical protein